MHRSNLKRLLAADLSDWEKLHVRFTIGSETFTLEAGDAVYFDSGVRHSYHRASKSPCARVIVTA